jgi:lysozyme family protein
VASIRLDERGEIMVDIAKLKKDNDTRWGNMKPDPNLANTINGVATQLVSDPVKTRYQAVSNKTKVPWAVIAVIHEREASQSWGANLAQGDPWNKVSIHVPKGRGPFASWEEAAVDALTNCQPFAANWKDWSIGGALTLLEEYNGLGCRDGAAVALYLGRNRSIQKGKIRRGWPL